MVVPSARSQPFVICPDFRLSNGACQATTAVQRLETIDTSDPTALTAWYADFQESWPLPALGSPPLTVRFSVGGVDSSSAGLTLATWVTICGATGSILFSRM